ncbi:hypothetical protein LTR08_000114 [Meristemomyces frigidus]|nr:hypothetical protein LTR08_000114 [Meristemomyces frigidus]
MAYHYDGLPSLNSNNNPMAGLDPFMNNAPVTSPPTATPISPPLGSHRSAANGRRVGRATQLLHPPTNASGSNATIFNPQATEFVPTMATSSKRKASASALSGMSTPPPNFRMSAGGNMDPSMLGPAPHQQQHGLPIVKSKDLFDGADAITLTASALALDGFLYDATSEDDMLYAPYASVPYDTLGVMTPAQVHRARAEAYKGNETSHISAILVSRDHTNACSTSDTASRTKYLPLCPASKLARGCARSDLTILPGHRERIDALERAPSQFRATWSANMLPKEMFDLVTSYLGRDDIASMRLVNHEFETNVSSELFRTSVVPFNTELYDMIDDEAKTKIRPPARKIMRNDKGKGRATDAFESDADRDAVLYWQNAREDKDGKVYKGHGLKVFQGFGPHIKRFGMSFEVSESQLACLPAKKELDHVESYHGSYTWPPSHYTRFANLAGLEHTADDTSRMKSAFENLSSVQELGLSIDSGLGWLSGLDKSVRAHVFERPSQIFGGSHNVPDCHAQSTSRFWDAISAAQASNLHGHNAKEITLGYHELDKKPDSLGGLEGTAYSDTKLWSTVESKQALPRGVADLKDSQRFGVVFTTPAQIDGSMVFEVHPCDIRKEQKEWLLETEWAQRAFLESYMLAIVDNPSVFGKVTTLKIAKLSSGLLPMISREHFWDALPSLRDVTLHVSPDWRSVAKDDAGIAEMARKDPSEAVWLFHTLLEERLSTNDTIKRLNIGWVGGGEHADGLFARNTSILPAPICRLDHTTANNDSYGMVFSHLEHLTLTNCWITPPALEGIVKSHAGQCLVKLTLDSVSLTAHPGAPLGGQQAQQMNQMNQMNQVLGNAAMQMPQNFGALQMQPVAGGLGHAPALVQWQHQPLGPPPAQLTHWQQPPMAVFAGGHQMPQYNLANWPALAPYAGFQPAPAFPQAAPAAQVPQFPAVQGIPMNTAAQETHAHWTDGHREGSWPEMLNALSPGPTYIDYLQPPAPWDEQPPPRPTTELKTIEFKSCGYAKLLRHAPFDQHALDADWQQGAQGPSQWFRTRHASLKPSMLETRDRYLAQIVQNMPWRELNALQLAWGLTTGWADRERAEDVEWDGLLPGGTGRFSGVVQKDMPLGKSALRQHL